MFTVSYIVKNEVYSFINPLLPEFFFRSFSGHSLKWDLFVYRLIVATLIGNFFDDPFLN